MIYNKGNSKGGLKMPKTNQRNIRRENIEAVFGEISSHDAISRSEIAKRTGLSLMTVGKVADILTECGAAVQAKPATGRSGRRAGFLSISESIISLVCDISSDPMTAYIVDLKGESSARTVYDYNYRRSPHDNLTEFFSRVSLLLLENLRDKTLIGSAVIYSGEYNRVSGELLLPFTRLGLTADPVACMKNTMGITPDIIENAVSCAVRSRRVAAYDGLYLAFDVGFKVTGCIVYNGEIISSEGNLDFSSVKVGEDTLDEALRHAKDEASLARVLCCALGDFCRILKPAGVYVWSKFIPVGDLFQQALCREFRCDVKASVDGAMARVGGGADDIFKKWIEKNIFGNDVSDNFNL